MPIQFDDAYLRTGDSWILGANGEPLLGTPITLTYSYLNAIPYYYNLTFSLPVTDDVQYIVSADDFLAFNTSQMAAADIAREAWAAVTNIEWQQVTQDNSQEIIGDVTLGLYGGAVAGKAFAEFPHASDSAFPAGFSEQYGGDIWFGSARSSS